MRAAILLALAAIVVIAGIACSSALHYPACERDEQCAVSGKHDYCATDLKRCVYCRTAADCAARQRCRAGGCETDPNAPPPPALDAGDDAESDSGDEEEAGEEESNDVPRESPRHVLPRGIRRYLHP